MNIFIVTILYLPVVLTLQTARRPSILDIEDDRLVGGDHARAGQFPFAAAIYVKTEDAAFFCGGSLLNPRWIITAGQCVENAIGFIINLGSTKLTEDDTNRVTVSTYEHYLHPDFKKDTLDSDVGLIKLHQSVEFTEYIGKLHLPVTAYSDNVIVTAIGWGQENDYEPGPVECLNFVNLITLNNNDCKLFYGSQITDNMICVSGNYDEGICTGDSGGPLIYFLNNRHPILVGVASFHSGLGCEGVEPSGYNRIFPYRQWILNVTDNLDDEVSPKE